MSLIGTADGSIGGVKKAPIPKICQTSYKYETWPSYALPKED